MAQSKFSCKVVDKSIECPICLTLDFYEPKQLPCNHTFCIQCLRTLCEDKNDGDNKPCPLCRREFCIPQGGVDNLPNNHFVMRLLLMKNASKEEEKPVQCDLCSQIGEIVDAEAFCKECRQCICSRCKKIHLVVTSSKFHNIVNLDERPSEEGLLFRSQSVYCDKHSDKEIELYCCDCYQFLCFVCQFENHYIHKCQLLQDVVRLKKEVLDKNELILRRSYAEEQLMKFQQDRENTLLSVAEARKCILETFDNICMHVLSDKNKLLDDLEVMKVNILREINEKEYESLQLCTELDSSRERSLFVMWRGTDYEVVKVSDELLMILARSIQSEDEQSTERYGSCIKFVASPAHISDDSQNLIGKLCYMPRTRRTVSAESRYVFCPDIFESMTAIKLYYTSKVLAIQVVNNNMYVIGQHKWYVAVYDSFTGTYEACIDIPDMTHPLGLAGCDNALYISDRYLNRIHRVLLPSQTVTSWRLTEDYEPLGFSMTSGNNVLVTVRVWGEYRVVEYSGAWLIRDIELDSSIVAAHQAIYLSSDQFIICHGLGDSSLHRLCVTNSERQIIKSYGREKGRGKGQLCAPRSLTVDNNRGHLFVADSGNKRVVMFDTNLEWLGQFETTGDDFCRSYLYFDSRSDRLFICCEDSDRVLIIHSPDECMKGWTILVSEDFLHETLV